MTKLEFGEAVEEEWAAVDLESWIVQPRTWRGLAADPEAAVPFTRYWAGQIRGVAEAVLQAHELPSAWGFRIVSHSAPATVAGELSQRFQHLVQEWKRETIIDSSVQRRAMHWAYQQIIGLGREALPLILEELEREPDYWFWALTAITGEDPARDETTLHGARERWLEWARDRGL